MNAASQGLPCTDKT